MKSASTYVRMTEEDVIGKAAYIKAFQTDTTSPTSVLANRRLDTFLNRTQRRRGFVLKYKNKGLCVFTSLCSAYSYTRLSRILKAAKRSEVVRWVSMCIE